MFPLSEAAIFSPLGFSLRDQLGFKPHLNYGKIHVKLVGFFKKWHYQNTLAYRTFLSEYYLFWAALLKALQNIFVMKKARVFCNG